MIRTKPRTGLRRHSELPAASLGRRRETPFTYTPALLEAVPFVTRRDFSRLRTWVTLACLRFTSLCPVTAQPDWGELTINYLPDRAIVESKSLKEYLNSFRMHGDFHEDVCRIICDDLVRCIDPLYLELLARFDARGSIAIRPYVQYARPGEVEAEEILRHRRMNYCPDLS